MSLPGTDKAYKAMSKSQERRLNIQMKPREILTGYVKDYLIKQALSDLRKWVLGHKIIGGDLRFKVEDIHIYNQALEELAKEMV